MTLQDQRPDRSMTLLREVVERPLDPGYAAAAERRRTGHGPAMPWWRRGLLLLVAAALGLGTVWAARELRVPGEGAIEARQLLLSEIETGMAEGERLRAANTELVEHIEAVQAQSLEGPDADYLDYIRLLAHNAGGARVSGPGLQITLDDSREAQAGEPDSEMGRVQDLDLQVLANGLWLAGAEAVAINGHRLSSVSAIRSAGPAIFVDLAPLTRPYVVEAIGDPEQMQARMTRSTAGSHLGTLRDSFGISVDIATAEALELPGSTARTLRHAEVPDEGEPGAEP